MKTDDERKTQAAVQSRRETAAGRPLGTLLLAKALGLTVDEARQLRVDVADTRAELGTFGTLRMVVSETVDAARMWMEADDE